MARSGGSPSALLWQVLGLELELELELEPEPEPARESELELEQEQVRGLVRETVALPPARSPCLDRRFLYTRHPGGV